jgi:anti-sigma B factor antagonist
MSRDDAADGSGDAEGQMPFAVRSARSDDVTVVEVTGEIDLDTAPRMREVLDAALETGDPVVIDMHGVTFMDSTGFGVLVLVNLRAMRTGTPVALRAVPDRIRNLLGLLGLEAVLAIEPEPPTGPPQYG